MLRKFLLLILTALLLFLIWDRTSISYPYYYSKAKKAYNASQYSVAIKYFDRALSVKPNDSASRLYYAYSLAKSEHNYYVQKALYDISQSEINDPATQFATQEIVSVKKEIMKGLEDNYIFNALSGQDIVHWDINSFPLKVFITNQNIVPEYYIDNIKKAMIQWTNRTSFVKFEITNDKKNAQIYIEFKNFNKSCPENEFCHYTVAHTTPVITSSNLLKRMNLTFSITNPNGENYSDLEIFNTALHELGHTLGIMGHSDNSSDVMYASNDKASDIYAIYRSEQQYLTIRDLNTVVLLYRLAPTITNVRGYSKTNLYYPEIILGDSNVILEKKLLELQKYIKNYPNLSSGYINISSVYANLGEIDMAFLSLKQAEQFANSEDEKYLIAYNRAILYFNSKNYAEALNYANEAKNIKRSSEIDQLIDDINRFAEN